ncbi:hypothetical protein ACIGFK_04060 [Streptomyces sp. NPDC085524]|uniref:hypothetical protein n=1 Tax=Streptomyces sp. NPDC085524 TaxID=3365728 RepID=UPI0037D1B6DC
MQAAFRVEALPGPTGTDFFRRAGVGGTKIGSSRKDDPAQVAKQGLDALFSGKDKVMAGSLKTWAQGMANKRLPDSLKAEGHRRMADPAQPTSSRPRAAPDAGRPVSPQTRGTS